MSPIRSQLLLFAVTALIGASHPAALGQDKSKVTANSSRPGSESGAATLSAGQGSGKMLTREELRECMKRQASIAGRRSAFDQARGELEREKAALLESGAALKTELEALDRTSEDAIVEYTAKVSQRDAQVDAWNARNAKFNLDAQALNDDQQSWRTDCAGHRYREDDEIAIRRGR
jgi:hypothetical protein